MTPILEASGLERDYRRGWRLVVDGISADRGEVLALVGASGAGKSTLLRILGLLERPDAGVVVVDGRTARTSSLAERRRISAALQTRVLWRGTVIENVEFGLRVRGVGRHSRRVRAENALAAVGLQDFETRPVSRLSGGQAQRVALARAIAVDPEILLLDEPLAHIDEPLRETLGVDLRKLTQRIGCATVWVTHDRSEALGISDHIGVMDEGTLVQFGPAMEIFARPSGERSARVVGTDNIIPGRISKNQEGLVHVDVSGQELEAMSWIPVDSEVFLLIRPEDITIWKSAPAGSSPRNRVRGKVGRVVTLGPTKKLFIDSKPPLVAIVTRPTYEEMELSEGVQVWAGFKATAAHVIRRT